jgi:tetratricopeptide (TPR) repeat protein
MCQIARMQWAIVKAIGAFMALAVASTGAPTGALAQRNGSDWDLPGRPLDQQPAAKGAGGTSARGNNTLEALDKILSSSKLSALDRSLYLGIRAYQLNRLGREADSRKDIDEMGKVLPAGWQKVLSSTLPELAGDGDRAAALRTLDQALLNKPGDPWLSIAQAQVYMQIADFQRALGLLDGALAGATADSDRRTALFLRGHANFDLGRYAEAAADFEATLEGRTTPKTRLSPLLWRYAAQVRVRADARATLARGLGQEDLSEWPAPIAGFLLGRLTAGELEVAAETGEAAKRANGKCPSSFFIGMDALRRGDRQRAREQFQLAQARCSTVSEFNWAATSELKRF